MSSTGATFEEFTLAGGLRGHRLQTRDGTQAELLLQGAHVLRWQPAGHRPVLWVSRSSWFESGRPIRGGIPICFPWFGPHPTDPAQPAHGLVRLRPWELNSRECSGEGDTIELCLVCVEGPFELEYRVRVGRELKCSLRVHLSVSAGSAAECEAALHTYLAVSDIRSVQVTGLESVPFLDRAPVQSDGVAAGKPIEFGSETDRIYQNTDHTVSVLDPGWQRVLTVSKSGSLSTVVWNPWIDKSLRMPDFGNEEWTGMLCIETAAVGDCRLLLEPGESRTIQAVIAVRHS
ncbi:MAG: D-hexose-6-phosphate mutarotase [Planctomycetaceae bacterium]